MTGATWTSDANIVLEAIQGMRPWQKIRGERTPHGVRMVIPREGVVVDGEPLIDGSWRLNVFQVVRVKKSADYLDEDLELFDLAVQVWATESHEPAWCVVFPPPRVMRRDAGTPTRPGMSVVFAFMDAADGMLSDEEWDDD